MKFSKIFIVFMVIIMVLTMISACGSDTTENGSVSSVTSVNNSNVSSSESSSVSSQNVFSLNSSSSVSSQTTSSESGSDSPVELVSIVGGSGYVYKFNNDIYKLDMPPITSIFFIKNGNDWYIVDACNETGDIDKFVKPAATKIGLDFNNVKGILITHNHGDHTNGLPVLLPICPNAKVYAKYSSLSGIDSSDITSVSDGSKIDRLFDVIGIPGHAPDAVGFVDTRTKTLFSGDAIQLYGVSFAGMYIFGGVGNYMDSMENLKNKDIENILISHPYVPNGAFAVGKEESMKYIEDSIDCMTELIQFTSEMYSAGVTSPEQIRDAFIQKKRAEVKDFPTAGFVDAIKSIISVYLK